MNLTSALPASPSGADLEIAAAAFTHGVIWAALILACLVAWAAWRHRSLRGIALGLLTLAGAGVAASAFGGPWAALAHRGAFAACLLWWAWRRRRDHTLTPWPAVGAVAVSVAALGIIEVEALAAGWAPAQGAGIQPWEAAPLALLAGAASQRWRPADRLGRALALAAGLKAGAQFVWLIGGAGLEGQILASALGVIGDGILTWGLLRLAAEAEVAQARPPEAPIGEAGGPEDSALRLNAQLAALQSRQRWLQEVQDRYWRLVEYSPAPIWIHQGGIFKYLNPQAVALLGVKGPEVLLGQRILDWVHPEDRAACAAALAESAAGEAPSDVMEWRLQGEGGEIIPVASALIPAPYEGGAACVEILIDLQGAQDKARSAQWAISELHALSAACPDALLRLDPEGRIVNARVDGTPLHLCALEGRMGPEALMTAGASARAVDRAHKILAASAVGGPGAFEASAQIEGRSRRLLIRVAPVGQPGHPIEGWIALVRDITQHRQAEVALRAQAHRLSLRHKELADFTTAITHDLQAPVRKITAFTDLLERAQGGWSDEARDYLQRTRQSAERLVHLLRDLHALVEISAEARITIQVDLAQIVQEVIADLEIDLRACRGSVHVTSLPRVEADPLQMRQLMKALISNAIKFRSPERPLEIAVSSSFEEGPGPLAGELSSETFGDEGGQWAVITVEDNGVGFDEAKAPDLFKLFKQRLAEGRGTGLGLALSRRIVEAHSGTLTVHSEAGGGSTFTVRIPRRVARGIVTAVESSVADL